MAGGIPCASVRGRRVVEEREMGLRAGLEPQHCWALAASSFEQPYQPRPATKHAAACLFASILRLVAVAAPCSSSPVVHPISNFAMHADRAPVRPNISLGDTLAGLHAAFGAVMALLHRSRAGGAAPGQVGDAWVCWPAACVI